MKVNVKFANGNGMAFLGRGIDDFLESYHNAVYNCLNI
jgi:hypothetical protein